MPYFLYVGNDKGLAFSIFTMFKLDPKIDILIIEDEKLFSIVEGLVVDIKVGRTIKHIGKYEVLATIEYKT